MFPKVKIPKKPIYLDHAATTPLDARVEKTMRPFWRERFGNPSSLYKQGRQANEAVTKARSDIAAVLNCRPQEIIFTAGGTESINLAIQGLAKALASKGKHHFITSAIEHHAVLKPLEALGQYGYQTTLVEVDKHGVVKLDKLKAAVRKETVLISVMYANNEIGTVQPIAEIGKWVRQLNVQRLAKKLPRIYFHTDACQAGSSLDLDVSKLGVDLMTVNGSKIYGPKQTGLLYVKTGTPLQPLIYGGGQEKHRRSGTENVPGIVGLATALQLAQKERRRENQRLQKLRDYFITQLFKKIPQILLNGHPTQRLSNNINISLPGIDGEALLLYLDSYNIAVSTGSACSTVSQDPSHVIAALGRSPDEISGSIRFTLGRQTTKTELDYVLKVLPGIVDQLRPLAL